MAKTRVIVGLPWTSTPNEVFKLENCPTPLRVILEATATLTANANTISSNAYEMRQRQPGPS